PRRRPSGRAAQFSMLAPERFRLFLWRSLVLPHHWLVTGDNNWLRVQTDAGDVLLGALGGNVRVEVRHGVFHEVLIVTLREVLAEVASARFFTVQGGHGHDLRELQQE